MVTPLRKLLLLFLCSQIVLAGFGRGMLVCTGPGGHHHLELLIGGCCDESRGAGGFDAAECGTCTDVPLLELEGIIRDERPLRLSVAELQRVMLAAPAVMVARDLLLGEAEDDWAGAPTCATLHQRSTLLRATVLRC